MVCRCVVLWMKWASSALYYRALFLTQQFFMLLFWLGIHPSPLYSRKLMSSCLTMLWEAQDSKHRHYH